MVLLETPKPAIVVRLVEPHVDPSTVVLMPRLVDIQGSLFQEGIGNLVVDVLLLQEMCLFIRRSNATGTYNVKNTRKPARLTILVILHTSTYATLLVREGDLSIHVLEPSSLAEGAPSFRDARCVLRKAACSWVTFVLGHRTSPGPRFGCHVLAFLGVHRPHNRVSGSQNAGHLPSWFTAAPDRGRIPGHGPLRKSHHLLFALDDDNVFYCSFRNKT
jgi:hypothetical protein